MFRHNPTNLRSQRSADEFFSAEIDGCLDNRQAKPISLLPASADGAYGEMPVVFDVCQPLFSGGEKHLPGAGIDKAGRAIVSEGAYAKDRRSFRSRKLNEVSVAYVRCQLITRWFFRSHKKSPDMAEVGISKAPEIAYRISLSTSEEWVGHCCKPRGKLLNVRSTNLQVSPSRDLASVL
jgi:hypothetical protein